VAVRLLDQLCCRWWGGWGGCFLVDSVCEEFFFEAVSRGSSAVGESGGEHQTVVGQR
jgi:hypothetical protein